MNASIRELEQYVASQVSERRFRHCARVAECAENLCRRYGLPPEQGRIVGLAHDLAREWDEGDLIDTALEDGNGLDELERERPLLLHGRAAAVVLERDFQIEDPDVLEALRFHTLGTPELCDLGRVLYCADYLEPGRESVPEWLREKIHRLSLPALVVAVIDHAVSKGKKLAPATVAMYHELAAQGTQRA